MPKSSGTADLIRPVAVTDLPRGLLAGYAQTAEAVAATTKKPRLREDKTVDEIDTLETVRKLV